MHFVNPYFLFALFTISIPIIIHLFNFRKFKKIYFTNVRFIKELKQQTQRKSELKHLIVLLLRILSISCLVFAFSQPYIPISKNKMKQNVKNVVSIYIDNSFSMEASSSNGRLLDVAKNKALEIASAYKSSDLFQLLTNDFKGSNQRLVSKDEFISKLDNVKISPAVKNISEVNKRQSDLLSTQQNKNKIAYILSDFQKNISDINHLNNDTNIIVYFIPVNAEKTNNLYIDSCWFSSPVHQVGQNVKLIVKIKNVSKENYNKIPIKLKINNNQRAIASFDIGANSETEIELTYTIRKPGIHYGMLEIIDYPITYDDSFYFSYKVLPTIPILCINQTKENKYLNSLYGKDSIFVFKNSFVNNIDYSSFKNYNLVILNELSSISSGLAQEIKRFIKNGGSLAIFPSANIDIQNYQSFLSSINSNYYTSLDTFNTKITNINLESQLYNDVFEIVPENINLPTVFSHYVISKITRSNQETLLKMQNGNIFLSVQYYGKGKLYLFAVSLEPDFSNFPKHAIFVPSLYKIALLSNTSNRLFYTIGKDDFIETHNISFVGDNIYKIKNKKNNFEIIPEYKNIDSQTYFYLHNQIKYADNYSLIDKGRNEIMGLSFNYDRRESNMNFYKQSDLENLINKSHLKNYMVLNVKNKPLSKALVELNQGVILWKLFIIFALFFLAVEVIILRFWK